MANINDSTDTVKLGDFCRWVRRNQGMSAEDVAQRSGGEITRSYIIQIETEPDPNPTVKKLKALAKGLGVTEEVIFSVARGVRHRPISPHVPELETHFMMMDGWPEERRRDAIALIKAVIRTIQDREVERKMAGFSVTDDLPLDNQAGMLTAVPAAAEGPGGQDPE